MRTWVRAGLRLTAAAPEDKAFNPDQPRDHRGRWIKVGSRVRVSLIAGDGEGTVARIREDGRFDVQRDDGSMIPGVDGDYLEVIAEDDPADLLEMIERAELVELHSPAAPPPSTEDPETARLRAMSPQDIDTLLAENHRLQWHAQQTILGAEHHVEYVQKMEKKLPGHLTAEQIAEAHTRLAAARAALEDLYRDATPYEQEYQRRPWPRAWIVLNSGGHAHKGQGVDGTPNCSTTYPTTRFGWLPQVAGMDERHIVEAVGETACTTCYPSAPVDALKRKRTVFSLEEQEEAAAKAAADAEKNAKNAAKNAKKITAPDGTPLYRGDEKWDVIGSVTIAQNEYLAAQAEAARFAQQAADRRRYALDPDTVPDPAMAEHFTQALERQQRELRRDEELAAQYTRYAEKYLEALAAKRGLTVEEMRAELAPKAHTRRRKEFRDYGLDDIGPYKPPTEGKTWSRAGLRLEVKAADAEFERKHPRDRNGRFIKIGGRVRVSPVAGGGEGTVMGLGDGGTISIKRDNGTTEGIAKGYLTVLDEAGNAPPPKPSRLERDAAHLAEHGVPTVTVPKVDVPPLAPAKENTATAARLDSSDAALRAEQSTSYAAAADNYDATTLTDAERQSIDSYVSSGHTTINRVLRKGEDIEGGWWKKSITNLDSAFAKDSAVTDRDFTVFRAFDDTATAVPDLTPGAEFTDPAYMSTSFDPKLASTFITTGNENGAVLQLRVPAGTRAIPVDKAIDPDFKASPEIGKSEAELLLARGLRMRVTGVTTDTQHRRVIQAEVVPGSTKENTAPEVGSESDGDPESLRSDDAVRAAIDAPGAFDLAHRVEGHNRDTVLEAIVRARGADGLPAVVPKEEVDAAVTEGGYELLRAVAEEAHDENFRHGDYYGGLGKYGNGIYTHYRPPGHDPDRTARMEEYGPEYADLTIAEIAERADETAAEVERTLSRHRDRADKAFYGASTAYGAATSRMAIRPDATVASLRDDLVPAQERYLARLTEELEGLPRGAERDQLRLWVKAMRDPGRFAAASGVDAYWAYGGELVVINRSVLLVQEERL